MAVFIDQKAKMLAGELYQASDPELQAAHLRAQAILAEFNVTPADAGDERYRLLGSLFACLGEGTVIKPLLRCDYGFNLAIGARSFAACCSIATASPPRAGVSPESER